MEGYLMYRYNTRGPFCFLMNVICLTLRPATVNCLVFTDLKLVLSTYFITVDIFFPLYEFLTIFSWFFPNNDALQGQKFAVMISFVYKRHNMS